MTAFKDQAVCIGARNYSETSQIVTLFGRSTGCIRAIAKGSRRRRAKFGGGIDLLTAGDVVVFAARTASSLAILSEFELTEPFTGLRKQMLNLYCAQYAAEMIAEFTEDFDPHEKLFDAFYQALKNLSQHERPELTLLSLELILLQEVGLAPSWHNCTVCSGPLAPDHRAYFSSSNGGVLCRDCEPGMMEKRVIKPAALKILQNPQTAETVPPHVVVDAHELLSYHQRELLGRQTKTMTFVNQLLREQLASPGKV